MELVLRDYQLESVDQLRQGIAQGHRSQFLCAPTGAGKAVMLAYLIQEARRKFSRAAFCVDRIALLDQISNTFGDYGIEHGVIQADHWRYRPYEPIQIISTGTMARRDLSKMAAFQLLCYDEAHIVLRTVLNFIDKNPLMKVIGASATPFTAGLAKTFSNIVNVTTTNKLIAEGWLSALKVYAARAIDMRGAKIIAGEWEPTEIERRCLDIIGDIVSGYIAKTQQHFGGPVKTIAFTSTVAQGEEMCRQFQQAGINFQQVSYLDGNDDRRRALIAEHRKPDGEIVGLVSVDALGRGYDVPDIKCVIMARPFRKSLSGVIQQLGRGMRPFPGKEYVLLLDHASNYIRFQDDIETFFEHGIHTLDDSDLDSKVRKEPENHEGANACKSCGYVMSGKDDVCPSCGTERQRRKNKIEHRPGELVEVGKGKSKQIALWMNDRLRAAQEIKDVAICRYPNDPARAERFAAANFKAIFGSLPSRHFKDITPVPHSPEVKAAVMHSFIKWVKSRRKHDNRTLPRP